MKRNYKKDEDAVSPVIATILMVAITVVLAAVLYVMVIGMGGTGTITDPLSLNKSTQTQNSVTILVSKAPNGAYVRGTQYSFTHDNDVAAISYVLVYDATGSIAAGFDGTWNYTAPNTADNLEWGAGMKMKVVAAGAAGTTLMSTGDELTITSADEFFGTTVFNV